MLKSVVALILLPTVLLTQWVSVGRCHGCRHVAGHDQNPHIHLAAFSFTGSTHGVREKTDERHHGCCHHHDSEDGGTLVRHQDDSTDHHGGGIVYLPTSLIDGWLTGRSPIRFDDIDTSPLGLPDRFLIRVRPLVCAHPPPPFEAMPYCPASLRTLPLLI